VATGRGGRERRPWGTRSQPQFGPGRSEAVAPREPAGGERRRCGGGVVECVGGQGVGEEGEEEEKVRFPYLARAGVQWGGLATVTDGGGGGVCEVWQNCLNYPGSSA